MTLLNKKLAFSDFLPLKITFLPLFLGYWGMPFYDVHYIEKKSFLWNSSQKLWNAIKSDIFLSRKWFSSRSNLKRTEFRENQRKPFSSFFSLSHLFYRVWWWIYFINRSKAKKSWLNWVYFLFSEIQNLQAFAFKIAVISFIPIFLSKHVH